MKPSNEICHYCKKAPRSVALFCEDCFTDYVDQGPLFQARRNKAEEERLSRIKEYSKFPLMKWECWVTWLTFYGFSAGLDFAYALKLYAEHGCELPLTALLSDHPDLELAVNMRTSQNPDIHPESVCNALYDVSMQWYARHPPNPNAN